MDGVLDENEKSLIHYLSLIPESDCIEVKPFIRRLTADGEISDEELSNTQLTIGNLQHQDYGCCSNSDCEDNDPDTLDTCVNAKAIYSRCISEKKFRLRLVVIEFDLNDTKYKSNHQLSFLEIVNNPSGIVNVDSPIIQG